MNVYVAESSMGDLFVLAARTEKHAKEKANHMIQGIRGCYYNGTQICVEVTRTVEDAASLAEDLQASVEKGE